MSLKNLSMRSRLLLSLVPNIICALLVSLQTYFASRTDNPELEDSMRMLEITNQQELAMVHMSEALRGYLLDPTRDSEYTRKKEADALYLKLSEELQTLTQDNKDIQDLNKRMADFDATTLDEKENQVADMIKKRDPNALAFYNDVYADARRFQVENFSKLKKLVHEHSTQSVQNIKQRTYYAGLMSIAALWIGMVIGVGLTAAVAFQVSKSTEEVFGRINKVSDAVAHSSRSIHEEAGELSEAVQRQSSAIQETAASVNEISAMIKNNSDSAVDSRQYSRVSRDHADQGVLDFKKLLASIDDIRKSQESIFLQVEKSHQGVAEINGIISQIDEKTRVINDIVFQTKLLSFNASVEAARAGEHGKGFTVVAEEVGNLARMSGVAAQDITGLLNHSTARVSSIIAGSRESVRDTIEKASALLDSSIKSIKNFERILGEITQAVNYVDNKVDAISTASREQETAVTEISKVMQGLDADTQKSALFAHHAASSAQHLHEQSEELEQLVLRMTQLLFGEKAVGKVRTPAAKPTSDEDSTDEGSFDDEDDRVDQRVA